MRKIISEIYNSLKKNNCEWNYFYQKSGTGLKKEENAGRIEIFLKIEQDLQLSCLVNGGNYFLFTDESSLLAPIVLNTWLKKVNKIKKDTLLTKRENWKNIEKQALMILSPSDNDEFVPRGVR